MNIQHMRYALEIDRQGSISKAAEALYMNQPNLSKAVRELERSLGITVFQRTSKGVSPTPEGSEFLSYAKSILTQIDEMEAHYHSGGGRRSFRISVPRSSYIASAFTDFVSQLDMDTEVDLYFSETNSIQAVRNITEHGYKLGVIRYRTIHEPYFISFLEEHGLGYHEILDFESLVLMSQKNPLARVESLKLHDLVGMIEIAHGDMQIPNMPKSNRVEEPLAQSPKRIYVYERGSQLDLLTRNPNTYMWVSPMPADILERGGLVQKKCGSAKLRHKDMLIRPKGYSYTKLEKAFVQKLEKAAEEAKKYI